MARVRISTTVDEDLLQAARACCGAVKDSSVMEMALRALLAEHRASEIDLRIDIAYREVALDQADDWGDLGSFLAAANEDDRAAEAR